MTDSKHFRINVDLSAFFFDHRRVARLFIKSNLKTIEDLKSRISEIFDISEFHLTAGGHFLPVSEDIRVLSNNESVCVIPKNSEKHGQLISKVTSSTEPKKHKKQKRSLEPIPEDSEERGIPKKKKSKKEYVSESSDTSSSKEEAPRKKKKFENNKTGIPDNTILTNSNKKKSKHKHERAETKSSDTSQSEVSHHKEKSQSIVDKEVGNIESAQKILQIKKKLKQKADEYITRHSKISLINSENVSSSNIKNVLPKLQSHIKNCDNLGRSTMSDIVRLSRHVDTPIKSFTKYTPPARITNEYLAKTKVNIVKIDVITKESEQLMKQTDGLLSSVSITSTGEASNKNLEETKFSESSNKSFISPPKNYVKEVIDSFEKSISPESQQEMRGKKVNETDTTEPKECIVNIKSSDQQEDLNAFRNLVYKTDFVPNHNNNAACDIQDTNNIPDASNTIDSKLSRNSLEIVDSSMLTDQTESTNVSLDISSIPHNSMYESGNSINTSVNSASTSVNLNASVRSRATSSSRRYAGVGSLVERLRESDSVRSNESDTSSQYVTKRKRIRKHRRKSKKTNEGLDSASTTTETKAVEPMNVSACPKMHIKFEDGLEGLTNKTDVDGDVNKLNDIDLRTIKTEYPKDDIKRSNSTNFMETVVLSDENDDPIMENKFLFGKESIIKAPLMTNKLEPKVGDVIAFKVLKVSEDYTPQVSEYIVGKLVNYLLENETAIFKILHGKDELLIPTGKFSFQEVTDLDFKESAYKEFSWTELIAPKLLYP